MKYLTFKNPHTVAVFGVLMALVAAFFGLIDMHTAAASGIGFLAIGDTVDASEIKSLIQKQGEAWTEYKTANDARLAQIEQKGHASEDAIAKIATIDQDLNKLSKDIADQMLKLARPAQGGDGKGLTAEQIEHKQALHAYLTKGDTNGLKDIERKAISSLVDTSAGYLVSTEMDAQIDRVMPTLSAMFRLARIVNVGTQKWKKRTKTSGMTMSRPGQGGTSGESTPPNWAIVEIEAHNAEVEPWVENETLEDADIDLAMDLADEAAIAFAEGLGSEYISGDGVGKARGITGYTTVANASYAWGKVGYIASGKSGAFASVAPSDKIIDLQHALKAQYRNGAVFLMSDATLSSVRQMKDSTGAYYLWQPDTTAGFGGRLLGSPVEIDDNMPTVAANSLSMAFGNFQRGYAIVNRRGTVLIRDNLTQKGVTKFNFTRRAGGGIYNFEAIKLLKMAAS